MQTTILGAKIFTQIVQEPLWDTQRYTQRQKPSSVFPALFVCCGPPLGARAGSLGSSHSTALVVFVAAVCSRVFPAEPWGGGIRPSLGKLLPTSAGGRRRFGDHLVTPRCHKKNNKKEEDQLFLRNGNKAGERMGVFSLP